MTKVFTVSQATPADGDAVGEIHAESWQAAYASFFAPEFFAQAVLNRRTKWRDVLAEGKDTALLAALDGRPLAFSFFGRSSIRPGSAEIFGFYGHPEGWGSGIAQALMTAVLDRIRADGFTHTHLWTLRDTPQSRRFYTRSGFTESGTVRDHDYGDGNPLAQVEYELLLR
ncbi:GNAT family N-acetyltransferase [Nonomuraea sp. NPDC050404]|uniref:GNAT family N-acetyltransferase n=1 Tax=Nonomuraea sp. NPDC050404 TaxID=3155783 RepID=UPI0033FAC78E